MHVCYIYTHIKKTDRSFCQKIFLSCFFFCYFLREWKSALVELANLQRGLATFTNGFSGAHKTKGEGLQNQPQRGVLRQAFFSNFSFLNWAPFTLDCFPPSYPPPLPISPSPDFFPIIFLPDFVRIVIPYGTRECKQRKRTSSNAHVFHGKSGLRLRSWLRKAGLGSGRSPAKSMWPSTRFKTCKGSGIHIISWKISHTRAARAQCQRRLCKRSTCKSCATVSSHHGMCTNIW